jgi:hypothetical protein
VADTARFSSTGAPEDSASRETKGRRVEKCILNEGLIDQFRVSE